MPLTIGAGFSMGPGFAVDTNGFTTPAAMNGSTTGAIMLGVTVNAAGLFVAVGQSTTGSYPVSATSTNGSTWTTPATMNGSTTGAAMRSVTILSSGPFVSVGYLSAFLAFYPVSATGTFN